MLPLHIITWNLHGPPLAPRRAQRFAAAAEYILQQLPDILCLQEVWFPSEAAALVAQLELAYVVAEPPHGWFPGSQGGLLTFVRRRSRWAIRQRRFTAFHVEAPVWRIWEGDGYANKGFHQLELERDGQPLTILNTHLQAQYGTRTYAEVRSAQVDQFNETVAAIAPEIPVVACGDFNTAPDDAIYRSLIGTWLDVTKGHRDGCHCGTTVMASEPTQWIDYVLLRKPTWTMRMVQIVRIESQAADAPYSDHHGLNVKLEIDTGVAPVEKLSSLAWRQLTLSPTRRNFLWNGACVLATSSPTTWLARLTEDPESPESIE